MAWRKPPNFHGTREYPPDDPHPNTLMAWVKRQVEKMLRSGDPSAAAGILFTRDLEGQINPPRPGDPDLWPVVARKPASRDR
jgi:hypothetical protein